MFAKESATGRRRHVGFSALLAAAAVACAPTLPQAAAETSPSSSARPGKSVVSDIDPAMVRNIQAIRPEATGVDGQLSWIIEPDVPTIPKVAGLHAMLPPHIQRRMSYAYDLAQRGATYSAIAEFQSVLGLCALEIDARDNGTRHRDALRDGLIALEEADGFSGNEVDWRDSADVRGIAAGHVTPVLRQRSNMAVDSIQAVQAYYTFAEERLAFACSGFPGASLALYGLGRTIVVPDTRVVHASGKAVLFHRVALAVAPQNVLAGNELGVLLAQHGLLDESERVFRQCVAIDATPEAYRNLAAIYARKGDDQSSRIALAAGEALAVEAQKKSTALAAATMNVHDEASTSRGNDDERKSGYFSRIPFVSELPNLFRR